MNWNHVLIIIYLSGYPVAYGYRGGIRDGVDGIADELCIVAWPIVLALWCLWWPVRALAWMGRLIGRGKR